MTQHPLVLTGPVAIALRDLWTQTYEIEQEEVALRHRKKVVRQLTRLALEECGQTHSEDAILIVEGHPTCAVKKKLGAFRPGAAKRWAEDNPELSEEYADSKLSGPKLREASYDHPELLPLFAPDTFYLTRLTPDPATQ